jgi:type IV pilus assembly protein PilA
MTMSPPHRVIDARRRRRLAQGFTLIELLAVVAMIGILAALAIVGYRRYLNASHAGDAKVLLGSIRIAQENYRAETLTYLGCSTDFAVATLYPATPDGQRRHWVNGSHGNAACWRLMNVVTDSPTRYGFAVIAGPPGTKPPQPSLSTAVAWPTPTEPWYLAEARGDNDNDTVYSTFVTSSFNGEVAWENESE